MSKRMKFLYGNELLTTVEGAKSSTGDDLGGKKNDCQIYFSIKKQTSMDNYLKLGSMNSLGNKNQRRNHS